MGLGFSKLWEKRSLCERLPVGLTFFHLLGRIVSGPVAGYTL
jgi:hypothetical protein